MKLTYHRRQHSAARNRTGRYRTRCVLATFRVHRYRAEFLQWMVGVGHSFPQRGNSRNPRRRDGDNLLASPALKALQLEGHRERRCGLGLLIRVDSSFRDGTLEIGGRHGNAEQRSLVR